MPTDWGAVELGAVVIGSVGVGKLLFSIMEAIKDYYPNLSGIAAQITCDVLSLLVVVLVFWQTGAADEPASNVVMGGAMMWFGIREVAKGEYLKVFDPDHVVRRIIRKATARAEAVEEVIAAAADIETPPRTRERHEAI